MSNVTVSNVRGPDVPLYMAGAQLEMFLAVSIAFDGIGLNVTGFSYNGTLWVCFVACRDMLPDPDRFRDCLEESFAELLAGALARDGKPVKVLAKRIPAATTAPARRRKPASTAAAGEEGAAATDQATPPKRTRARGVAAAAGE
jgi:hypothetical protein